MEIKDHLNIFQAHIEESPPSKAWKRERRKLVIEDIEKLIDQKGVWKWFSFPIYIPTEWLEGWKDTLVVHSAIPKKRGEKLFELLETVRKKK
jgi:hypothetical protein